MLCNFGTIDSNYSKVSSMAVLSPANIRTGSRRSAA